MKNSTPFFYGLRRPALYLSVCSPVPFPSFMHSQTSVCPLLIPFMQSSAALFTSVCLHSFTFSLTMFSPLTTLQTPSPDLTSFRIPLSHSSPQFTFEIVYTPPLRFWVKAAREMGRIPAGSLQRIHTCRELYKKATGHKPPDSCSEIHTIYHLVNVPQSSHSAAVLSAGSNTKNVTL